MTTAPITAAPPSVAGQVITLHGETELIARAGHLFEAKTEFICAAVDTSIWSMSITRDHALRRLATHRAAGVAVYKLYNPAAVAEPADLAHLARVAEFGAQVRICPSKLPHEAIIIDGRVAILAGPTVAGERDFSVVSVPGVVEGVRSLFMTTWQAATDLAEYLPASRPQVDEQGLTILRLLSAGQKDETAARQLGFSVRTYRRRVAELMDALGASSRFQAGVRARELGLRI